MASTERGLCGIQVRFNGRMTINRAVGISTRYPLEWMDPGDKRPATACFIIDTLTPFVACWIGASPALAKPSKRHRILGATNPNPRDTPRADGPDREPPERNNEMAVKRRSSHINGRKKRKEKRWTQSWTQRWTKREGLEMGFLICLSKSNGLLR